MPGEKSRVELADGCHLAEDPLELTPRDEGDGRGQLAESVKQDQLEKAIAYPIDSKVLEKMKRVAITTQGEKVEVKKRKFSHRLALRRLWRRPNLH